LDLYAFLKAYQAKTGNLDQLYEKNVRRFLGGRVKVNKGMQVTLRQAPEQFGLYNNGVTVVVSDFKSTGSGSFELIEPNVVNGCQTTRTIWQICDQYLDAGGTGSSPELDGWRAKADRGCVVLKIAKVGRDGEVLLQHVTRFTNSQNAVRDKDFIALDDDFKRWQKELGRQHQLYLEIQRGGWDSERARQLQRADAPGFINHANALDLIKVYGAGWMSEPGLAFGKNPPFLPGGSVYQCMVAPPAGPPLQARDLFAAYLLQHATQRMDFRRGGEKQSRRQTKFLFHYCVINLLRDVLTKAGQDASNGSISQAVIRLLSTETDGGEELLQAAAALIDTYMSQGDELSVAHETAYREQFGLDLNAFLKWEQLGRDVKATPRLAQVIRFQKQILGRVDRGRPSASHIILASLKTS
jgi:hypothetical protein